MVFARQTVEENLLLGRLARADRAQAQADMAHLLDVFPALKPKLRQAAGELSGGQQQMLAIARGLMSNPKLLLLDEPSLGLSPLLVDEVATLIARLRAERGMSLLLVEQNPLMAARLTERVYVLQNGAVRSELASREVLGNAELLDAYLGRLEEHA
jgi:branched-chain amino acid transport system ATP-binding protein